MAMMMLMPCTYMILGRDAMVHGSFNAPTNGPNGV